MPEAVERPLLLRRPDPWDARARHGRVKLPSKKNGRRHIGDSVVSGKDEAVTMARIRTFSPPACEKLDHVGDQVHVSSLTVLRCAHRASGVAAANTHNRLLEVN